LCVGASLGAQEPRGTISGVVTDSKTRRPLSHASVGIPDLRRGATTDANGRYELTDVPAGPMLLRTRSIGYRAQSATILVVSGESSEANFALKDDPVGLIADCFCSVPRRADSLPVPGPTLSADHASVTAADNPTRWLVATVPGVSVTLNNGEPGANAQVRIRGGSSISLPNDPLYVLDGVPLQNTESEARGAGIGGTPALGRNPLNSIPSSEIESITVLKDIEATVTYGGRGATGVVLIETKTARQGAPHFEFESSVGAGQAASLLNFLSGDQYRAFLTDQVRLGRLPSSRLSLLGTDNTNWEKATQRRALSQNQSGAFSAANPTSALRASFSYTGQQGVVISSGFDRLQGRVNASHAALDGKLKVAANVSIARVQNNYVPYENTGGFEGGVFQNMAAFDPTRPIFGTGTSSTGSSYYELGPGRQSLRNPVALAAQVVDEGTTKRTIAGVTASYAPLNSVSARVNIGADQSHGDRRVYLPRSSPAGAEFFGFARVAARDLSSRTAQAVLQWSPAATRDVQFDALGGYEFNTTSIDDAAQEVRFFSTDAVPFGNLSAGARRDTSAFTDRFKLAGAFARANLGYKGRYFVALNVRRDGASRFDDEAQGAISSSISGVWRIFREPFAERFASTILNLRVGYGVQSNQSAPVRFSRPDSTFERVTQGNIALDFSSQSGRVGGSLAYYSKRTANILLIVPARPGSGFGPLELQGLGALSNSGFELSLDATPEQHAKGGVNLTTGIVLSVERNRVLSVGPPNVSIETAGLSGVGQTGVNGQRIVRGVRLGTFFGPSFAGYSANGAQTFTKYTVTRDAMGLETGRIAAGVTESPTFDDIVPIGDANPSFSLGVHSNMRWRRLDASWLWRAEQGRDVFNNGALVSSSKSNAAQGRNFLAASLGAPDGISEPTIFSSRWIENGSFVRLQNITLGYTVTLPGARRSVRAFVAGDNLLSFTPYTGYDPEVFVDAGLATRGVDYLTYPRARTATAGVQVRF
jgi:TonB-dependent starch-binding outer membrane protein SusC